MSKKRNEPCAARDLYISDLFRKSRAYAELTGFPWFVLSAQYGLVSPNQVIEPYEKTLNTMPILERRRWADRVSLQLDVAVPDLLHAVFLAGSRYRDRLGQLLVNRDVHIEAPMVGLRIGEQLRWLRQQLELRRGGHVPT